MSRRRISSSKRFSRSRKSSGEPGELEENSDVFDTDDPNWYKRVEANNTRLRPSLQLSNAGETTAILDSESDIETVPMGPPPPNWWKSLSKFDQTVLKSPDVKRTSRPDINTRPSEEDGNATEESVDSEPDRNLRNRKRRLFLGSQRKESLGGSAFLKALNDSAGTVASDPGSSKKRKSMTKTTFLSDEDSFKRTNNSRNSDLNENDETEKTRALKMRKLRPTLFKQVPKSHTDSTENVFKNFLDNVSSNSETSVASVNKSHHSTLASQKAQKSDLQSINEIEPSQEPNATRDEKRRSKDLELSHNLEQNLSQNQRATRSRSKTADISISPNSKAKASLSEEQKGNSTFESNISDFEVKKKRPGFFRVNRKSIATNAFENAFTSEEESNHSKSMERNSSQRENSQKPEKQNRTNPNESHENIRLNSIIEENNPGSRLRAENDDSDSESVIDVEYKNDESEKSSKDGSLKSTSKSKRKSDQASQIVSESHSKHTRSHLTVIERGEEEEVVSIGSQRIEEHSNRTSALDTNKNQSSDLNKSKSILQNVEYSKQSSRSNKSAYDLEKQVTSDRLSILNEQPQYESTRKIDVRKSRESLRKSESKRDSKLSHTQGNENHSKRSMGTEEELIEELTPEQTTTPLDRLSIFNEQPQYESTRKIDVQKSRESLRKSESKRDSKLSHTRGDENYSKRSMGTEEELTEELPSGQTVTLNRSRTVSSKKTVDEEEESDTDIEVSDLKDINVSKNKSNISNLQERNKSKGTNAGEISEQKSRINVNTSVQLSQKEGTDSSERSHTISLSEGQSIEPEMLEEISTPIEETNEQHRNTSFNRSYQKLSKSNVEESLLEDNSLKKQPSKPTITSFEVLNPNNVDLSKFKGDKKVGQSEANAENKFNSVENNLSRISKTSTTRETPVSTSIQHSMISTKDTHVLTVEEEFSRLHADDNSEMPSTSHGYSHGSRNALLQEISRKSKSPSKNQSSNSSLRKTLEYDDESDVSENPLLVYTHHSGDIESDDEQDKSPKKKQSGNFSQAETNVGDHKQKMIDDYFKPKNINKSDKTRTPSKSTITQEQLTNARQKIAVMTAKVREELFKPKPQESPEKKLIIVKRAINKKKKIFKPVDPAYMVNGVVYKPPKLPRPAHWATDRLYKYIWKKIEPKYKMATRVRSEKLVLKLGEVVKKVMRLSVYKNYEQDLEDLMREMARLGIIVNRKDFNDFCIEFLPYSFRVKATPMLLPGNKLSIPYDPDKFYTPLI